mmetsp:Transcript_24614/g.62309  ORF Transcript_24614/g.62309 Transcript_24614/m.62309 type:complete len:235 (-) Transcript_24614:246-950(-)
MEGSRWRAKARKQAETVNMEIVRSGKQPDKKKGVRKRKEKMDETKVRMERETAEVLRKCFEAYDFDDSGHISRDELKTLLDDLRQMHFLGLTKDYSIEQFDEDKSGAITFEEFYEWFMETRDRIAREKNEEANKSLYGQSGYAEDVERAQERLPERFKDAESFQIKKKEQHPLYETSNNSYGGKAPTGMDLPLRWHGREGDFTKTFLGGQFKDNGLTTAVTHSRVHPELDEQWV